jgi:hypothetical protein
LGLQVNVPASGDDVDSTSTLKRNFSICSEAERDIGGLRLRAGIGRHYSAAHAGAFNRHTQVVFDNKSASLVQIAPIENRKRGAEYVLDLIVFMIGVDAK